MKKTWPILLCAFSLQADQFSMMLYNDSFVKTDHHFTNGLSASWLDDSLETEGKNASTGYSAMMYSLVDAIPFVSMDTSRKHTAGIALSQIVITPDDLTQSVPQYDDVPYTGYLTLSFYFFEWDNDSFREYRLEPGVVGRESGAGWSQRKIHKIPGKTEPMGWDTQLETEWTLNALYQQGYKSWRRHSDSSLDMDWFNHFGIQLGNYTTDAFAGTMFRIGQNYVENFNVSYPYLKQEAAMLQSYDKHQGFGWSMSAGANAELLAYSYIFSQSEKEGYMLDKNTINASPYAGASLYYDDYKITFFIQGQSYTLNEEIQMDTFGGLRLAFQF